MDGVPYAFCEAVCAILLKNLFPTVGELSGHYGDLVRRTYPNMANYVVSVEDGVEKPEYLRYVSTNLKLHTPEE
uniref:Glutathione S-transferase n=1 Tax=Steinernema glaseri TaxID=37863 RepID=A0A1I8APJ9_9BILA